MEYEERIKWLENQLEKTTNTLNNYKGTGRIYSYCLARPAGAS
jgi:hypothetical protein